MDKLFFKKFLFFILVNVLIYNEAKCDCQDWEAYKTDKCFKIIKEQQFTFERAKAVCKEYRNASLLIIENAEEQSFLQKYIFETNKMVENIWIGLQKNKITGEFRWVDNSPLVYRKWGKENPSNRTARDCVHMTTEDGVWANFDCNKKNAVVCQRMNEKTMSEMQMMMLRMEKKLKENEEKQQKFVDEQKNFKTEIRSEFKKRLESDHQLTMKEINRLKLSQYNFSNIPIGFIYVQLSNQPEPTSLFPNTKWSDISIEYAGLFFRTLGGSSASFGDVQEEASPRIAEANTQFDSSTKTSQSMKIFDENSDGKSRWTTRNGDDFADGIYTGNLNGNHGRHLRFRLSLSEVRPKNTAVKIWKRIK